MTWRQPQERPKYGALNHRLVARRRGAALRVGAPAARAAHARAHHFCYPDSVFEPEHFGTATHLDLTARADRRPPTG